jgi:hypothetical protein
MGFNDPNKPKILRTHLTEDTLKKFKALAAIKDITMNDYLEKMILNEIKKGEKANASTN